MRKSKGKWEITKENHALGGGGTRQWGRSAGMERLKRSKRKQSLADERTRQRGVQCGPGKGNYVT